jgi:hypothetical protein
LDVSDSDSFLSKISSHSSLSQDLTENSNQIELDEPKPLMPKKRKSQSNSEICIGKNLKLLSSEELEIQKKTFDLNFEGNKPKVLKK